MLDLAARKSGVSVSQETVTSLRNQIPPQRLQAVRQRSRLSVDEIDEALRSFLRVREMFNQAATGIKASEADLQHFVRQVAERVRISLVALDASEFVDNTYEPTEEQIKAQLEQYKDQDPVEGSAEAFGYRLPEAVQVEYIKVDVGELTQQQKVSDDEAYRYWKAHSTEFLKPSSQPVTSTAPASQPTPEPPKPYTTFTEAKPQVKQKLQEDQAKEAALRVARELFRYLDKPWADAPTTQPGDYRVPPVTATNRDVYPKLIETLQVKYPKVLSYARTQLVDAETLGANEEIGKAGALVGTPQQVSAVQAAFFVPGLEADRDDYPNHIRFFRNVYETVEEPFVDDQGNAYVMRTVAVRPKQAPESVDVVRERVVKDLRLIRAYGEAEKQASTLADQAKEVGVVQAFKRDVPLQERLGDEALNEPEPFARMQVFNFGQMPQMFPAAIPGAGQDSELVEECFAQLSQATTKPVNVFVHDQPDRQRWVVVQVHEILPVKQDEYEQQRALGSYFLRLERFQAFMAEWYSPEQIRARVAWEPAVFPADEEDASAEPKKDASSTTEEGQADQPTVEG